jgi:hypothetical protein
MARQRRYEFPGALHLVTIRGPGPTPVFYDSSLFVRFPENPRAHAPYAIDFEDQLWAMCEQYDARVHAYIIEPNAALVIVQSGAAPLSWLMHDVLVRHARHRGTRLFPRRYRAQLVQPAKLPYVVRHVERRPTAGTRRRPGNHPFSSSLIYCGRRPRPACFSVDTLHMALAALGHGGRTAYFEFMASPDSPSIAAQLAQSIIGDEAFRQAARAHHGPVPRTLPPEEILQTVSASILYTAPQIAYTSTHRGALARALVAWYAMRTGVARISAVAEWFGVTGSDLRTLIRRHRQREPHYFTLSSAELFPSLVPAPPARLPPIVTTAHVR